MFCVRTLPQTCNHNTFSWSNFKLHSIYHEYNHVLIQHWINGGLDHSEKFAYHHDHGHKLWITTIYVVWRILLVSDDTQIWHSKVDNCCVRSLMMMLRDVCRPILYKFLLVHVLSVAECRNSVNEDHLNKLSKTNMT